MHLSFQFLYQLDASSALQLQLLTPGKERIVRLATTLLRIQLFLHPHDRCLEVRVRRDERGKSSHVKVTWSGRTMRSQDEEANAITGGLEHLLNKGCAGVNAGV